MSDRDWEALERTDWLFRKMVRRFVKERDRISVEGISLPGMLILHKIIREGEQRLGDLAEQLDFTSGAITALTDKLEKKGLTIRRRKEDDRRTVLLDITSSGREMYARNSNIGARCITLLFEGFTTEELEQQSQFYERVVANLEDSRTRCWNWRRTMGYKNTSSLPHVTLSRSSGKIPGRVTISVIEVESSSDIRHSILQNILGER